MNEDMMNTGDTPPATTPAEWHQLLEKHCHGFLEDWDTQMVVSGWPAKNDPARPLRMHVMGLLYAASVIGIVDRHPDWKRGEARFERAEERNRRILTALIYRGVRSRVARLLVLRSWAETCRN